MHARKPRRQTLILRGVDKITWRAASVLGSRREKGGRSLHEPPGPRVSRGDPPPAHSGRPGPASIRLAPRPCPDSHRPDRTGERVPSPGSALPPDNDCPPCQPCACPSRAAAVQPVTRAPESRHLARRVDLGLVLDQQPHNRLVAIQGSSVEARVPVLPGGSVANGRVGPGRLASGRTVNVRRT